MGFYKILDFKVIGDDRGNLVAVEGDKDIPFEIKRVYYIFATRQDVRRGYHAHRDLQQVLVCLNGSCRILLDDGKRQERIMLDSQSSGLYIKDLIWREMYDFSPDCVLMVLADKHYNEADYIRNYHDFKNIVLQKE